jgi:hypothetical protein
MNTGIRAGRCEVWVGNFGVNIGRIAMGVKLTIISAEIFWGNLVLM